MEARVWIGTKGRYNPLQQYEEGSLTLDGDLLTLRASHGTVSAPLAEVELGFPRSMTGAGFVLTVQGVKLHIWFYDPYAGRSTVLAGGDQTEAQLEGAWSWFSGRRAAKPWLRALRSATG